MPIALTGHVIAFIIWYKYVAKLIQGHFYPNILNFRSITAFMELLSCIIFVNSQLYGMWDEAQVLGRGQWVNCVKIF